MLTIVDQYERNLNNSCMYDYAASNNWERGGGNTLLTALLGGVGLARREVGGCTNAMLGYILN